MEDTSITLSDQLENPDFNSEFFGDLMSMASDYKNRLILEQLAEEINK